jgi:hypothetical protein
MHFSKWNRLKACSAFTFLPFFIINFCFYRQKEKGTPLTEERVKRILSGILIADTQGDSFGMKKNTTFIFVAYKVPVLWVEPKKSDPIFLNQKNLGKEI